MLDQFLNSLMASGPMAVVLGTAAIMLWRANAEERTRHFTHEESGRRDYLAAQKAEADRHSVEEERIRNEYVQTLKKLSSALKDNE